NSSTARPSRNSNDKKAPAPAAYIPTPDSTGIVDNYEELYPPLKWKDPVSYACTSTTVEEATSNALAHDCTYYMDERDKEWLDKNNEEARGEGTSAQGAMSSPSSVRSSARSAKAKGKEPEQSSPVVINEDEFELVVGLFEKVTHEKTEHLHLSLEGMAFPPFSDYQETFAAPLIQADFAAFVVPSWIPPPSALLRIARAVYPHWRERRLERGGHRIIPTLNGDENDTLNESYICFRRREIKAARKTRASQVTSSDKLLRLQGEFSYPLDLAKAVLAREGLKQESARHAQNVWEKRLAVVDLKRKFPALGDKADDELLIDKERPTKKVETSRLPGLKIRTPNDPSTASASARIEPVMRPAARAAMIQSKIDIELTRQRDHHWEDGINNAYQAPAIPYTAGRLSMSHLLDRLSGRCRPRPLTQNPLLTGRCVCEWAVADALCWTDDVDHRVSHTDRQSESFVSIRPPPSDDEMDVEDANRLRERWRFDSDDGPAFGPDGPDEQDRVLTDEYEPKYLRHSMCLLTENDHQSLTTDTALHFPPTDGSREVTKMGGFRLGMQYLMTRRDASGAPRSFPPGMQISQQPNGPTAPLAPANGTPIATQIKKMPPANGQHLRISSNGGMRPPGLPIAGMQNHTSPPRPSPPHPPPPQHTPSPNGTNGQVRVNMPHAEQSNGEGPHGPSMPNGIVPSHQPQEPTNHLQPPENMVNGVRANSPARPKSQNQHVNGYQLAAMMANGGSYLPQTTNLSMQQVQSLKLAFAAGVNSPINQDIQAMQQVNGNRQMNPMPSNYLQVPNGANNFNMPLNAGTNINLKLPPTRQMNWTATPMRPNSVNGMESAAMNGMPVPVRTPSANGSRNMRPINGHPSHSHSMSPHLQHSPSPHLQHSPSPIPSQSPPRPMQMGSPSMQQQQPFQNVY
ncbi:hypothetical protein C8R46DRAFT_1140417, partial [Mycena filopes]